MGYCKKCGEKLKENEKFCISCGEPNTSDEANNHEFREFIETEYAREAEKSKVSKKKNLKIVVPIIIVIMAVVIGGVAFIKLNASSKAKSEDTVKTENPVINETEVEEIAKEEDNHSNLNVEAEDKEKVKESEAPIKKKIVVLDPGHSSNGNRDQEKLSPDSNTMKIKDPGGAQGSVTGTPEYVVAMSVTLKLKVLLEQNGITVIMTKTQDIESPGNIDRAEVGNKNNADLSLRIHCDSADSKSAKGASMLVPAPVGYAKDISEVSKKYGGIILNDLVASAGMYNRGVIERSDLTGFNWSKVPVVLVEMGFMSNPEEDKLLNSEEYQNKLAEGLCNGILNSLK